MSELRDLYQEVILDHNRHPRNFHELPGANRQAEGYNPLCGDQLKLFLKVEGDVIKDISFMGSGCAISKASASMMTENLLGKNLEEAKNIFQGFHQMVTGEPHTSPNPELGKLAVFSGVCEYPSRIKCASLAWHTLNSAIENTGEVVNTEKDDL